VRPGMGKYLSIGPDRVDGPPTSPRCKSRPGGFMQHSLVIPIGRSWMARYQHTQRGVMETSRPRHWVPSMGPRIVPATSQPLCHFVPRSISFGWRWPDWWVCHGTLRFGRPTTIMGPILDMVVVCHAVVAGAMCEESGWRVNMGLLCLVRACSFMSSVVTPWGYKSRRSPLRTPTSSRTIHHSILTSFPTPKEREWEKKRENKKGGLFGFRECCFSFPL
jgi:hypothetical protein